MNLSWKWVTGLSLVALLLISNVWQLYRNSQLKADLVGARNDAAKWQQLYEVCKHNPQPANTSNDAYGSEAGQNKPNPGPKPPKPAGTPNQSTAPISPASEPLIDSCVYSDTFSYGGGKKPLIFESSGVIYFPARFRGMNHRGIDILQWPELPGVLETAVDETHWMLSTGPWIYRNRINLMAGIGRIDENYGISAGVISDLVHIGGGINLDIRF